MVEQAKLSIEAEQFMAALAIGAIPKDIYLNNPTSTLEAWQRRVGPLTDQEVSCLTSVAQTLVEEGVDPNSANFGRRAAQHVLTQMGIPF